MPVPIDLLAVLNRSAVFSPKIAGAKLHLEVYANSGNEKIPGKPAEDKIPGKPPPEMSEWETDEPVPTNNWPMLKRSVGFVKQEDPPEKEGG